jgi:hypothetical protein
MKQCCKNCYWPHFRSFDREDGHYVACYKHPDAVDHAKLMYNIGTNKCSEFLDKEIKVCLKCKFYDDLENYCKHKSNAKVVEKDSQLTIEHKHKDEIDSGCEYFTIEEAK